MIQKKACLIGVRAGVRQLFLFHHDSDHGDDKIAAMVTLSRQRLLAPGSTLRVSAAREGAEVVLVPRA